jgi:hypothetical protein
MTPNQGVAITARILLTMLAGGLARAAGGDSTQPTRCAWRLSSDRAAGVVEQLKRLAARFHVALANYESGRRAIERARNHDEAADIRDKAEAVRGEFVLRLESVCETDSDNAPPKRIGEEQ